VILPPLLAAVRRSGPGVDVHVRMLMPASASAALDARQVDATVVPLDDIPARFDSRLLYEEDFVLAMRADHPLGLAPSLQAYCAAQHLVFSLVGDTRGFIDTVLEQHGLSRRVALTVPSFMLGLAILGETDLVAAMPRGQVRMHGSRFGVVGARLPVDLGRFGIRLVTPKAAATDAGLAWLTALLQAMRPS
jgi:DNA-binding transcriptional LysR family regulator